jgi:hypothetical protein
VVVDRLLEARAEARVSNAADVVDGPEPVERFIEWVAASMVRAGG